MSGEIFEQTKISCGMFGSGGCHGFLGSVWLRYYVYTNCISSNRMYSLSEIKCTATLD